jgi:urease beta subunit
MKELVIRPRSSPERLRRFPHILRHVAIVRLSPIASREDTRVIPGEYLLGEGDVIANQGRRTIELNVANTGDRPIQVGSHFHFFEANRALRFDRAQAFGMRLNVPAGTAVRFEPGDEKRVTLVELAGARRVFGLNGLTAGGDKSAALARLSEWERQ